MALDKAQEIFIYTNWKELDLNQSKLKAYEIMNSWTWKKKVPQYEKQVKQMQSKEEVISFLWNSISSGLRFKRYNENT